tara:strand:+ start:221 stop:445 length:225 start_codon:yes stop_codon:yes gene_type:complete
MKINKRQLRRIIKEEKNRLLTESPVIGFEWDRSGLAMEMHIDGQKVASFMNQREVEELIHQLQDLLAGPMRTSP